MFSSWPWSARIGAVAWAVAMLVARPPLEVAALTFAPCVILPLALSLAVERVGLFDRLLLTLVQRFLLPAALLVLASLTLLPQGMFGAALVVPWLGVTAALAFIGVRRLRRGEWRRASDLGLTAGLGLIVVGGGWLLLSRLGIRPQEFSHAIVLLTAVHFHYAGFALPILAALAAESRPSGAATAGVYLTAFGVPLTGVGISLSPPIEIVAVAAVVFGCGLVAGVQLRSAFDRRDPTALTLLAVSSMSLAAAMVPALLYGWGEWTGRQTWTLPQMISSHGMLNAFGFAFCGLAGRRQN